MSITLDTFINKAVSEVRNSKKTGKKGRVARKNLRKGQSELERIKQTIRDTAKACEQNTWRDTRLIARTHISKCKSCQTTQQSCTAIYLERTHEKLGIIQQRLDEVQIYSFPNLKREAETVQEPDFICSDCFLTFDNFEIHLKLPEPHPKNFESLSKWEQEYRVFSQNYDRLEREKILKRTFPKTLLLTYTGE